MPTQYTGRAPDLFSQLGKDEGTFAAQRLVLVEEQVATTMKEADFEYDSFMLHVAVSLHGTFQWQLP